jgi:HD-like signal output (HDOD) protein/DNA-binding response OmpR family regulator
MSNRHVVVVFLAESERTDELAGLVASDQVEVCAAHSSEDFYRLVNYQRIDAVVIENALRSFLSGMDILERIYSELLRPATVLIANPNASERERAGRLGIDCIIRPTGDVELLKEAVDGILATRRLGIAPIPLDARKLVQQADGVRPFPQVLVKLSEYLDHENVSTNALAKDIAVDPKITAELLKLTNSTALGLRNKATTVVDAVNMLGVRRTVALVLSAGVMDAYAGVLRTLPLSDQAWYQKRSVVIASTAAAFARNMDEVSPDTAYVLGLMQDIGILVLGSAHGERYVQLLKRCRELPMLRLETCEREEFDITHADVSAALLQKWEMPQSMISLVLHHHSPETFARKSPSEQKFLRGMQIGEALANLIDCSGPHRHQVLTKLLDQYDAKSAEQCRACIAEGIAKAAESSKLFAIPVPDEDQMGAILDRLSGRLVHGEVTEQQDEPHCEPETVVVVEDDPENLKLLSLMLEDIGFRVRAPENLEALESIAADATSILCDVHLSLRDPVTRIAYDGIEVVKRLREAGHDCPVLMVSADSSRRTVEAAREAGANGYVLKPFSQRTLLHKLGALLNRRELAECVG